MAGIRGVAQEGPGWQVFMGWPKREESVGTRVTGEWGGSRRPEGRGETLTCGLNVEGSGDEGPEGQR